MAKSIVKHNADSSVPALSNKELADFANQVGVLLLKIRTLSWDDGANTCDAVQALAEKAGFLCDDVASRAGGIMVVGDYRDWISHGFIHHKLKD